VFYYLWPVFSIDSQTCRGVLFETQKNEEFVKISSFTPDPKLRSHSMKELPRGDGNGWLGSACKKQWG